MRVRTIRGSGQIGYRMTRRRHDFGHPHSAGHPLRTLAIWLLASLAAVACIVFPPTAHAATVAPSAPPPPRYALVTQDAVPLRAGAKSAGSPLALLTQGELLEVRGQRLDYLQVWDLARERGGFVRAGAVRALTLAPTEAPELLALVRFLRDRPGSESLGLGLAAAYLKAAPAGSIDAEPFDAMGTTAERLAWRANVAAANAANVPVRPGEPTVAAQLEVAAGLGVRFTSLERDGHVWLCYDGDAFRHVLALGPTPEQSARAALALTRHDCIDDMTPPLQRWQIDRARADLLARVPVADLPPYVRNRIRLRQAGVWSAIAFEDSRRIAVEGGAAPGGLPAVAANDVLVAGNEALEALAGVDKGELADDDQSTWTDAAMRVGASRWAAEPAFAPAAGGLHVATQPGQPGETCVLLVDAKHGTDHPLARRCTFGTVWTASARVDAGATAVTLAVQPLATWRELWMFRKGADGWTLQVLPPSTEANGVGYVEFAGWVPGTGQVLAAREVRDPQHASRFLRTYELLDGRTLATQKSADAPSSLKAFHRFQDPGWKRLTVSLR
ncbi:MAG: hypothetical protein ACJ8G1_15475 [Vitreoscilla sp.]